MAYDPLFSRLRESVLRLTRTQERIVEPLDTTEATARESVQKLSRSRVSSLLRQLRAAYGYSYEQIQERTGLSQQLLFDVEYRDRRLTLEELRLLADCYHVSAGDILGIDLD
ncbi:MAG: helix-turn-helix domain-containing protein [Caldilineaceae bacterium]|nr:helix-turn-helix domain-containing protein [Caldilineaceae bacterium]